MIRLDRWSRRKAAKKVCTIYQDDGSRAWVSGGAGLKATGMEFTEKRAQSAAPPIFLRRWPR